MDASVTSTDSRGSGFRRLIEHVNLELTGWVQFVYGPLVGTNNRLPDCRFSRSIASSGIAAQQLRVPINLSMCLNTTLYHGVDGPGKAIQSCFRP